MLKQRIITGAILIPIMVVVLLKFPTTWLAVLFGAIALAGAWEWASLVSSNTVARAAYAFVCAMLIVLSWYWLTQDHVSLLMLFASIYWVAVLILLSMYRSTWLGQYSLQIFLWISGYFVIVTGWIAIISMHKHLPALLLFLFVLVWVADSAAYFAGKRFGRIKLAEKLSPGKTREGLWGAILATLLFALYGMWQFDLSFGSAANFIILCVLTALISVVGDLFESLLKRNAGAKDSGFLIPGHGGVLDRIDSLLAASPVFVLGLYWLQL